MNSSMATRASSREKSCGARYLAHPGRQVFAYPGRKLEKRVRIHTIQFTILIISHRKRFYTCHGCVTVACEALDTGRGFFFFFAFPRSGISSLSIAENECEVRSAGRALAVGLGAESASGDS